MSKKELFMRCVNSYMNYHEYEGKLADLNIDFWENDTVQELVMCFIHLLNYLIEENEDEVNYTPTDLEYFLFETDCGADADKYYIIEEDGTEVHLYTIEDLWNYLVKKNPKLAN